ncbi:unnamed protein product [Rhizophagus irregularis]|nr:unnamed protein product [Rhizophagus irregularis]
MAQGVYFMSNPMNFNYDCQFQERNLNRRTLSLRDNLYYLSLPKLSIFYASIESCDIIWKINIKKIISSDCFIRFTVKAKIEENQHILKYEDILKLEGLGWILYVPFHSEYMGKYRLIQVSIETKKESIDMQIDISSPSV